MDLTKVKLYMDVYGIGVRAGNITPQIADEEYMRGIMDLPPMSDAVRDFWAETDGIRKPTTLKGSVSEEEELANVTANENGENKNEE